MRAFIGRQIREIAGDAVLRTYGGLLALVHVLTAYFWLDAAVALPLPKTIAHDGIAICWPFFPGCGSFRPLFENGLHGLVLGYGAAGLVTAMLWFLGQARVAWGFHLALEVVKVALVVQDYRLRLNEHYMALFAAVAFLLFPRKRDTGRVLLVCFYFWAGVLKLTPEWLTGAALYRQPWLVPPSMNALACKYVLVLELAVSWFALARPAWLFWPALLQLVLFHVVSWGVVGYFYPLLMFLLLSLFVLARRAEATDGPSLLARLARGRLPAAAYALCGFFSLLQLVPKAIPGDSALTGEGRWMALHMFDARIVCKATIRVHFIDGSSLTGDLALRESPRIHCDPLVVWSRANGACRDLRSKPGFSSFDLVLDARHSTDAGFTRLIDYPGFCPDPPRYRPFGRNDWIRIDGGA